MAMMPRRPFPALRGLLLCGTALAAAAPALAQAPNARPQGGVVSGGSATIAQDAARTQVNQATDRAVIDWRGFDVGRDHAVRFQQPGSGSMTLNRVNSADPSRIAGQVTANGGIAIVNQSGVIFAPGARVEAQSVIVSTADIANQRFMAGGRMVFDRPGRADARILNEGTITAREAGIAALVAPQVANRGVISARLGTVAIAGAETHVIDLHGDGLMSIEITSPVRQRPADGGALVSNDGTLQADGGRVSLTAAAADGIVQNLVRAGGRISANTDAATGRRGEVVVAGTGGAVIIEGQVEARGIAAGQRGGTIEVVADRVLATAGARIDASGTAGGGEIAFGQTRQGSAAPRRAERTGVAAGAELRADATVLGQGGRIVLHSTDTTLMGGTISARGGPQGGDGGFVEVSGERGFRMLGAIDVSAPAGRSGTVLFDPDNLRISDGPAGGDTPVTGADLSDFVLGFGEAMTNAVITTTQIGGIAGDLVLQATNSITVESAVFKGQGGLTLQTGSAGSIAINASIGLGIGDLVLIAGTGGITQASGAAISLNSGQLRVQSGGDVSLTATGNTVPRLGPSNVTGNFTIAASGLGSAAEVLLEGAITVSGTFDITGLNATLRQAVGSVITTSRLNAAATGGSGLGGNVVLTGANQVATLGNVTAADSFIEIVNADSLTVDGSLQRLGTGSGSILIRVTNGDLTVNGTINAVVNGTGGFGLTAAGNVTIGAGAVLTGATGEGSSSIRAATPDSSSSTDPGLPGRVTLAGWVEENSLVLGAGQGGIVQTGGTVVTGNLSLTSGGDVILDRGGAQGGTPNSIVVLSGFTIPGNFVLDNGASDLTVSGAIVAANIGIITSARLILPAQPSPTVGGTGGFLSAVNGRVSLRIGDLVMPTSAFDDGPRVRGAVVEIAPATQRPVLLPFPNVSEIILPPELFVLFDSELALIAASDTLRIGATTFGGVTTATATSVDVIRPLAFAGTLDLRSLGTIAQAADANLSVGALAGAAGGAVTLTNAGNSIGFLDDFSAGGGFSLTAGAINLRGLLSAPGQIVTLNAGSGIQSIGTGRIEAGELRAATQAGSISLTGANQLDRLGESSSPGDLTLVNAGPQMTIPSGQTVQAGGTGNVTATAGSITVDGTIRAAELSLSAPTGTVTVNGFSAIAFAGGLALAAQNVTVNGLIAGTSGITVNATQAASLAGIAQTPTLTITASLISFGGLDASASNVFLNLGGSGSASGALAVASLQVADGSGTVLTGSIAGNTTGSAAVLGRRFASGTQLGDPPPNQFDYLFNDCPIGASSCARPVPPTVPPFSFDIPTFTVADNPRGLMGELDPAGQPLANPLVRIPVLPFITQSGRDTSEDRELAPPNIRAEDF